MASITEFIGGFKGGNKANRFEIHGKIGAGGGDADKNKNNFTGNRFHVRSASLPASTFGAIPVNFRGRTVLYPGERVYAPWTITVLDDNKSDNKTSLYTQFHDWSNQINDHDGNVMTISGGTQLGDAFHTANWTIYQLSANSEDITGTNPIRKTILHHCWPVRVGEIQFDMSKDNQLAAFEVEVRFSYMDVSTGVQGAGSTE
jgi:hypothetical protein